jgi:hypothetical protein
MRFRAVCLSSLLAFAPAAVGAQRLEYVPDSARFLVSTTATGSGAEPGSAETVRYETRQVLTLVLSRARADTLALRLSVDSLSGQRGGVPLASGPDTRVRILAAISPLGMVHRARIEPAQAAATMNAMDAARFLPILGGRMRAGATWSDTIATPVTQFGLEVDRRVVTTYRALGDTTIDGTRAWRIARTTSTTLRGRGASMGETLTFESTGEGSGTVYVSVAGKFLGASTADELRSTTRVGEEALSLSGTQRVRTVVRRLP